ncbi:MAG: hypothetical protein WC748_05975 [Legionellales bacterium]|jgi:hypothetical protein
MKRHSFGNKKTTQRTTAKPQPGFFSSNLNWLSAPAGLLMMMVVYYFVGRQGQNAPDALRGGESTLPHDAYAHQYGSICQNSLLLFSNRVPNTHNNNAYYPVSCWATNDGEFRVGTNFTTEEEKEDFAQADSTRLWKNQDAASTIRKKTEELRSQYFENYLKFQTLLQADNPPAPLKYRFQLEPVSQLLQKAYTLYHTREDVQCGDSVELTIVKILMQNFPSLENLPVFLRLHAGLSHDESVVPDFIHYSEHSTLILLEPGTALTQNIANILAKNTVKIGDYIIERFEHGSVYASHSPGFREAKNEIVAQVMKLGEGIECDAWAQVVGKFPAHCVSQAFIANENPITRIQFLNLNDNPLIPRLLEFFTTTYAKEYQWLLESKLEAKDVSAPRLARI